MSVVSEVSPNTRKLDVGDFFREAIFLTRSMHKIILKTPYKMAMAFGLRGEAKYYFHKWRSDPKDTAGKLHYLEMTQLYLQRLIDDVKKHDIPQCRP